MRTMVHLMNEAYTRAEKYDDKRAYSSVMR